MGLTGEVLNCFTTPNPFNAQYTSNFLIPQTPFAFGYNPKVIVNAVEFEPNKGSDSNQLYDFNGVGTMTKLGEILLRKQLISLSELEQALLLQNSCYQQLGEILLRQGLIQESDLTKALQEQYWRRNGYWIID